MAFAPPAALRRGGRRVDAAGAGALSGVAGASSAAPAPATKPADSFVSPAFRVYIEDTDAYGVLYNGNYLRSYERAVSHVPRAAAPDDAEGPWMVSAVADQKFRSSPALGEEYVVRGERRRLGRGPAQIESWQLELAGRGPDAGDDHARWTVHNSATVVLGRRAAATGAPTASPSGPSGRGANAATATTGGKGSERRFSCYRDELDAHRGRLGTIGHHVPLRNAMNFFERARSDYLGGPTVLRRLQAEDDLLWVVTSVDDGELSLDSMEDDVEPDASVPAPGREVIVRTEFLVKRRGMVVECRHELLAAGAEEAGRPRRRRRLLARATVTIMALRGSTRRPTSKLPPWLLDRLT